MLDGEHLAGPAETGDHLIGDQEDPVPVAYVPEHRPVVVAGYDAASGVDGLCDDRRHGGGVVVDDELFDGLGTQDCALGGRLTAQFTAVGVGLRRVYQPGLGRH